jgi:hypothetical protein
MKPEENQNENSEKEPLKNPFGKIYTGAAGSLE